MRVLTLIQPWASLVMLQEKTIETRSWKTNYRGEIAIHAGKKVDKSAFNNPKYTALLEKHNLTQENIVKSSIICTCELIDVIPTDKLTYTLSDEEKLLGNYAPGRYGWILKNIKSITPIPNVKGKLGVWKF